MLFQFVAAVGSEPDQSVVGARPDAIDVERRRRQRINHAALLGLRRGLIAEDAHRGWHVKGLAREVRADLLPTLSAVARGPEGVRGKVHQVRIERREDNRLGADDAKFRAAQRHRHDVLRLRCAAIVARQLAAVDDVGIERIGNNVAVFFRCHRMPVAKRDLAVIAAAGDADRAALLLAAAQAIGKRVVGIHVIKLRRRLVVPRTPALAAIDGDDRALVAGEDDDAWSCWD